MTQHAINANAEDNRLMRIYLRGSCGYAPLTQNTEQAKESKTMTFKPIHDNYLVRPLERNDKTKSGLFIPTMAGETSSTGLVVAVGQGLPLESGSTLKPSAKEGDRVLFKDKTGCPVQIDGEEFLILKEREIFGIFND